MGLRKILRYSFTLAVMIAAVYFFYLQFEKNADLISAYDFNINPYYIFVSIVLGSIALLSGPLVWRIYVNNYIHEKLNYSESYSLYCTSAMFKYIPGKIWTYAAQITLMSSKRISKLVLIYINMVSFLCLAFVSAMFAFYYYLFCVRITTWEISVVTFTLLIVLDFIFIIWNESIINFLIVPVNRLFKVGIKPLKTKKIVFVYTQIFYFISYILLGVAMYFLASGLNMKMPLTSITAIMATISVSAITGYVAFFSMGGLGVREGTMFFMLRQFSGIEAALLLPIATRILLTAVELFMGIIALLIGLRYGYFTGRVNDWPEGSMLEKSKADADL